MTFFNFPIIDPLLSIGISLFVLWNVVRNLKNVMHVFLQKTPSEFSYQDFERDLLENPLVKNLAHLHVWSLDGEHHVASVQLGTAKESSPTEISNLKKEVRSDLADKNFTHVTIETQPSRDDQEESEGSSPSDEKSAIRSKRSL
jgi:cobalt-zinc-cadmium efflux system protein